MEIVQWVVIGAAVLCGVYLVVLIAAKAWFQAKLEHTRQVLKQIENGEKDNG